jgi:hypothetical protein
MRSPFIVGLVFGFAYSIYAQVPDATPTRPSPVQSSSGSSGSSKSSDPLQGNSSFLGKDIPVFNPGSEIVSWDGKNWNINQNRLFQARFEKYLSAPEETTDDDRDYNQIIRSILDKLVPDKVNNRSLTEAFGLLTRASHFDIDANLSDALAQQVYSYWVARRQDQELADVNADLETQTRDIEYKLQLAAKEQTVTLAAPTPGNSKNSGSSKSSSKHANATTTALTRRMTEITALKLKNTTKRELSEVQVKLEFQALMVQFFLQRRFQHVLMATRFYRHVVDDGKGSLKVGGEAKNFFSTTTGMPPTVGTLDTMASEAIRDVREGVSSYKYLLQQNELESASKRLGEAFAIGEYVPEIRTLPRDQKRQALVFSQKANRLLSALEVKDYALAEDIVKDLEKSAKDFDNSKVLAAIETARTISKMHLAKAKNAAVSGDKQTLESELKEATMIWPRNPALAEVSSQIFSQADVQQQALIELDQLISQKNYRQIYDDKVRFIAATALQPNRQDKLKKILEDMQTIEGAIMRSNEISKRGDFAGAWENAERVAKTFPDDSKLSQLRANLTTEAADFVRTVRTAQQLEDKGQTGSSLAWYLKAQKLYPPSEYAQEGIYRLVKQIIPST